MAKLLWDRPKVADLVAAAVAAPLQKWRTLWRPPSRAQDALWNRPPLAAEPKGVLLEWPAGWAAATASRPGRARTET
eukprot:2200660-Prymnesium_polylepis.1